LRRVRWLQFTLTFSARQLLLWMKSFVVTRERQDEEIPTLSLIDPVAPEEDFDLREMPHLRSVSGESA
jgi:hypothetical protein